MPRSKKLSDDFIGVGEPVGEFKKELLKDNIISLNEIIMNLFPSTPLITKKSLSKFFEEFTNHNFHTALIISKFRLISKYRHLIQRSLTRSKNGFVQIDNLEKFKQPSQDLEDKFNEAGQWY